MTVLTDAQDVMDGPRQHAYGDPVRGMERIGRVWAVLLDLPEPVPAHTVALLLAAMKLVRETGTREHHRDNLVDAASYVRIAELAQPEERKTVHEWVRALTGDDPLGLDPYSPTGVDLTRDLGGTRRRAV